VLSAIKSFFEQYIEPSSRSVGESERGLMLGCAALLSEVARMDEEMSTAEQERVIASIQSRFSLTASEAAELERLGKEEAREATDYYQFTSLINRSFSLPQKIKLVEQMWRVAYADQRLHRYEEHLVRKIADLLYVPHAEFIAAKHRARNEPDGHGPA
jgi:uncharacterized tellurite resistance protein B-like protein